MWQIRTQLHSMWSHINRDWNLRQTPRSNRLAVLLLLTASATAADPPPINVPEGFHVVHYADDALAHDIHSMTVNSLGQIVVSGPGYIRILLDTDSDGTADEFQTFANAPKTGAQGMHFQGPHLLSTGDTGLQIFRDRDHDNVADGPPETLLQVRAGGEHHIHSIQRGPDGWWYVLAGNQTGITEQFVTLPTSPISKPQAGVLMRLKPDLSGGEVLADGYRNAYDFAFNPAGDVFTFDSDGERDVSLPWYQPCRVFHMTPRSHAGWVSNSWKRPSNFPGMPPVLASFGRGCPTGVACYRHVAFPSRYEGALFVLDWTFGRIMAVPLTEENGSWRGTPSTFATARGNFGFAVTDIEVGKDGSLFVSVGGRGTRGGVYRISYDRTEVEPEIAAEPPELKDVHAEQLRLVLTAPQPLSAWSRNQWFPMAKELGAAAFAKAATDEGRRPSERVRAIEVLTDVFQGLDDQTIEQLTTARSIPVRARAAWAVGRTRPAAPDTQAIVTLLNDDAPLVLRFTLEALQANTNPQLIETCLPRLAVMLKSGDTSVRTAASQLVSRLSRKQRATLASFLTNDTDARLWLELGGTIRSAKLDLAAAKVAAQTIQDRSSSADQKVVALRLLQLALGDVGPKPEVHGIFESYTAKVDVDAYEVPLKPVRALLAYEFPSGHEPYDHELIRTIAILKSGSSQLADKLLAGITPETLPTDDIHRLAALARNSAPRSHEQSQATAHAIVQLEVKSRRMGLKRDSNWDDRVQELYTELCSVDSQVPQLVAQQSQFGLPGHVPLLSEVPPEHLQTAIDAFARQIESRDDYDWTNDVVFVLGRSTNPDHQKLIRDQSQNPGVRDAVFVVISRQPNQKERAWLVEGLNSTQVKAIEACTNALSKLPKHNDAVEQFALLAAARRLNGNEREYKVRENVVRLLQNNMLQSFNFVFGTAGHGPQPKALGQWHTYLETRFPDYQPPDTGGKSAREVLAALQDVQWHSGDAERGKALFAKLSCARCHGGRKALGPDLNGVARRFSRSDLFAAIVDPNRNVPDRYQLTTVVTKEGRSYSGLIVYQSVDGLILRDAEHKTYRIESEEIESKTRRRISLMPANLLQNVGNQDLADLDAYLQLL